MHIRDLGCLFIDLFDRGGNWSYKIHFGCTKSISYEVADGILVYGFESSDSDSASSSGRYDHAAVWCPDQQVYLPSVRCSMNKAYIQKGDELLVVRGDRGNGRKPSYFAINKDLDAARKDSKICLTK